jgi:phosphatidylglycerol---prolipoprotein diacylglyceryl transferase
MLGLILYPMTAVLGILLSAWAWERLPKLGSAPTVAQRHVIFAGALLGMVLGAKLAYLVVEGWLDAFNASLSWRARSLMLLQGKSVTGALLGAYLGVELAKRRVGYRQATGDTFALLVPFSLALGRVGCWSRGCCLGVAMRAAPWTLTDADGIARWPAVPLELAFNAVFFAWVAWLSRRRLRGVPDGLRSQLFHVYLASYGALRFAHEFVRDTPRWWGPFSGYQLFALATLALGLHGFARVQREQSGMGARGACV